MSKLSNIFPPRSSKLTDSINGSVPFWVGEEYNRKTELDNITTSGDAPVGAIVIDPSGNGDYTNLMDAYASTRQDGNDKIFFLADGTHDLDYISGANYNLTITFYPVDGAYPTYPNGRYEIVSNHPRAARFTTSRWYQNADYGEWQINTIDTTSDYPVVGQTEYRFTIDGNGAVRTNRNFVTAGFFKSANEKWEIIGQSKENTLLWLNNCSFIPSDGSFRRFTNNLVSLFNTTKINNQTKLTLTPEMYVTKGYNFDNFHIAYSNSSVSWGTQLKPGDYLGYKISGYQNYRSQYYYQKVTDVIDSTTCMLEGKWFGSPTGTEETSQFQYGTYRYSITGFPAEIAQYTKEKPLVLANLTADGFDDVELEWASWNPICFEYEYSLNGLIFNNVLFKDKLQYYDYFIDTWDFGIGAKFAFCTFSVPGTDCTLSPGANCWYIDSEFVSSNFETFSRGMAPDDKSIFWNCFFDKGYDGNLDDGKYINCGFEGNFTPAGHSEIIATSSNSLIDENFRDTKSNLSEYYFTDKDGWAYLIKNGKITGTKVFKGL